ncbi:MAG: hypothetical protein JNL10_16520 [Verrucomicrobiales bacterium]|nr:hypothetical protein [Verrucomicrobiales bacterium]
MPPQTIDPDHFSADTRSFLALLHRHRVRYVIVGGEAVIFHGYARYTGDVDFLYDRSEANVRALYAALTEFWDGDIPGIHAPDELLEEAIVIQFGRPPNRIDLLSSIDGAGFEEAWNTRVIVEIAAEPDEKPVPVFNLGLETLLKNKAAAARPKDLDDLRYLRGPGGGMQIPG